MRRVEQLDVSYSTDESRCSVFAGICKSQELFEQYWEKDYDLLEDDQALLENWRNAQRREIFPSIKANFRRRAVARQEN